MTDLNLDSTLAKNPVSTITPIEDPPKDKPSQYDEVLNQYSQSKPEETIPESTPIIESTPEPESKSSSWAENIPKPEIKTEPESIPETPIETTLITEPTPQPEITPEPEIKTEPVILEPSIESVVESEITPEPESETFLKPQPEIEVTPEPLYSQKTPDQIKQEISQILDGTSTDSTSNIVPPVKSKTNIFQILFVLSLIIFLIVVSAVVYFVFFNKTASDNSDNSVIETITPTPISSATCTLNDKTYKVGEGFPSADGCNTCSCSQDGSIACTLMACESTSSASKSATSSSIPKDWKTYTNSTYKYSIKHPQTWGIEPQSIYINETSFIIPSMDLCRHNIFYYKNFNDYKEEYLKNSSISLNFSSLSTYINDSKNTNWKFINKTTDNNQTFYKVSSIDSVSSISYFIENNQTKSFSRVDLCNKGSSLEADQFVSSFKFN